MSGFFRWSPSRVPTLHEDVFAEFVAGSSWGSYTPADPSKFQLIVREVIDPNAFDEFKVVTFLMPNYQGFAVAHVGDELFYRGAKVGDIFIGDGEVVITFTPNAYVTNWGRFAGFLAHEIWYTNSSTDLDSGETLVQRMQLLFVDDGVVVSENFRNLKVFGADEVTNQAPVAEAVSASGLEGMAIAVQLSAADPDAGDSVVSFTLASLPAHGAFYTSADGTAALALGDAVAATGGSATIYFRASDPDFNGTSTFSYTAFDGEAHSAAASGTVTLAPVNDAPVAVDDTGFGTQEDTALTITVDALLANDSDPDLGDSLQLVSVAATSVQGATVAYDDATGRIVYQADSQQFDSLGAGNGTADSFSYTVSDSAGLQATATVTVQVTGAADGADLLGTVQPDWLTGTVKNERIAGDNGNDRIDGRAGADRLYGQNGDDQLWGGDGADRLWGDRGNDTLYGQRHNDDLFGGQGQDLFVFDGSGAAGEIDRIGDFKKGVDFIRLEGGVTIVGVQVQDVGQVGGDRILAGADGVDDTVITLSSGAVLQLIGLAAAAGDGLLA